MSSTPRSTLPLDDQLERVRPGARLADLQRVARHVDRRVDRVGREVQRDRDRRRSATPTGADDDPQAASASTRKTRATRFMAARHRSLSGGADRSSPPPLRRRRRRARATCASTPTPTIAAGGISGLDADAALPRGRARGRRPLRADPRRDQLRLGLVRRARDDDRRAHRAADGARARRAARGRRPAARARRRHRRRDARPARRAPADAPLLRPRSTSSAASSAHRPMPASSATAPRRSPSGSPRGCRSSTTAASTSARRSPPTTCTWRASSSFADIDRLTIFADNLVPHVLRLDGVLRYSDELAAGDRRRPRADRRRRVRARAARLRRPRLRGPRAASSASPPRLLDNWLWNRGQLPPYSERPAHITRTVYY